MENADWLGIGGKLQGNVQNWENEISSCKLTK